MAPKNWARVLTGAFGVALMTTTQCGGTAEEAPSTTTYPAFASTAGASWSQALGGKAVALGAVALAADGSARVAGTLTGSATIGASVLASAGGTDVLIAKLGGDGEVLWAQNFGDLANQQASAAGVDAQGDTVVVGTFAGTLDFSASNEPVITSMPVVRTFAVCRRLASSGRGRHGRLRRQARSGGQASLGDVDRRRRGDDGSEIRRREPGRPHRRRGQLHRAARAGEPPAAAKRVDRGIRRDARRGGAVDVVGALRHGSRTTTATSVIATSMPGRRVPRRDVHVLAGRPAPDGDALRRASCSPSWRSSRPTARSPGTRKSAT